MDERRLQDEQLLIDYLTGRCDAAAEAELRRRLDGEPDLRRLHDNLSRTLRALDLLADSQPPADLVERTLERIERHRRTAALARREELARPAGRPTFSLRELVAVAAAAVVMAAVFIPSIRQAKRQNLAAQCESNVGQVGSALLKHANAHDGLLPQVERPTGRWLPAPGERVAGNSEALFKLVRGGYVPAGVFRCPAVEADASDPAVRSAVLVVSPEMADFPSERFIHYSYQHALGPRHLSNQDPDLAGVAERMGILADNTPVFRQGRFLRDRVQAVSSDNHGQRGQNVLYMDGHVEWRPQPLAGVRDNNIFLADGIFEYHGDETPVGPTDTFLLPAYVGPQEPAGTANPKP